MEKFLEVFVLIEDREDEKFCNVFSSEENALESVMKDIDELDDNLTEDERELIKMEAKESLWENGCWQKGDTIYWLYDKVVQ